MAAAAKKQEVAPVQSAGVPATQDGWGDYQGPLGRETMDREDIAIPRLKLCQDTTKEVKEGKYKAGQIINSATGEVICDVGQTFRAITVCYAKEYILWRDINDNGGGIMARATRVLAGGNVRYKWDKPQTTFETRLGGKQKVSWVTKDFIDEDGLKEWGSSIPGTPDSPPAATVHHNFVLYLPDHGGQLVVASLKVTQVKKAQQWLAMINTGAAPIFARCFRIGQAIERNAANSYWNFVVAQEPWTKEKSFIQPDDPVLPQMLQLFKDFSAKGVQVKYDDEDNAAAAPADEGGKF